jgi:hypothetical protein
LAADWDISEPDERVGVVSLVVAMSEYMDAAEAIRLRRGCGEHPYSGAGPLLHQGSTQRLFEFAEIKGLAQDRPGRAAMGRVAGHEDDLDPRPERKGSLHQRRAVQPGHPDVGDQHLNLLLQALEHDHPAGQVHAVCGQRQGFGDPAPGRLQHAAEGPHLAGSVGGRLQESAALPSVK